MLRFMSGLQSLGLELGPARGVAALGLDEGDHREHVGLAVVELAGVAEVVLFATEVVALSAHAEQLVVTAAGVAGGAAAAAAVVEGGAFGETVRSSHLSDSCRDREAPGWRSQYITNVILERQLAMASSTTLGRWIAVCLMPL